MIIRSQDKKSITTDLNLTIYEDDWTHKFEISNDVGIDLGEYSTEEKAIKVLDMICNRYQAIWDVENGFVSGGGINFGSVFQMPQDSEV